MTKKQVVIVGGVAGGATCATRLRRMDENAEILVLDRGPYVSFANCGLPYYVGNVIHDESKLLLATPASFRERFNIEVRTRNEVTAIDRESRTIAVRDLETGREYRKHYDALVLSPGAEPICPPWPGIDLPGIFTLRTIPDSREFRDWIDSRAPRKAVVVGGGFIGLEMAENLAHRGITVTIVELANQLLPPLDPEMAEDARQQVVSQKVTLLLGDGVSGFERTGNGTLKVRTQGGEAFDADLVVLAIGVRPETKLARDAGLDIGACGGIRVDSQLRSSDSRIWAIGDAIEVKNLLTGQWELVPLAGPANRQGRVAADAICGRDAHFEGVQATAVCGFFGSDCGAYGCNGEGAKSRRNRGLPDRISAPHSARRLFPWSASHSPEAALSHVGWTYSGRAGCGRIGG